MNEQAAAVASAAAAAKGRAEKHWKIDEDQATEEGKARNLDFGSYLDYYETPKAAAERAERDVEEPEAVEGDGEGAEEPKEHEEAEVPAQGEDDVWEVAHDAESNAYYFNRARGLTQWERPEGARILGEGAAGNETAEADAATHSRHQEGAGPSNEIKSVPTEAAENQLWFYRDVSDRAKQGPFALKQLQTWKAYMPMDVQVWFEAANPEEEKEAAGEVESLGLSHLPIGEAKSLPFADLMGHADYLRAWREERGPENCLGYGIAPTLPVYESMLRGEDTNPHALSAEPTFAAAQALDQGSSPAKDYASSGYFDARNGRFQAALGVSGTSESANAYSGTNLGLFMDLSAFEQQMEARRKAVGKKFTKKEIDQLRARKKEVKKRMRR